MQVDLTPWGARHFLRTDMDELAEKVVDLKPLHPHEFVEALFS